jgi:hypothetical protein
MNGTSLQSLQPWLKPYAEYLVSLAPYAGARTVRVTSARRSRAQQVALYKRFLAGQSSFPAAPPGLSKHEYGLAWDMVTEPLSALHTLGRWWKQLGGTWSATDVIHFEV